VRCQCRGGAPNGLGELLVVEFAVIVGEARSPRVLLGTQIRQCRKVHRRLLD
jgi:hypothetical protein